MQAEPMAKPTTGHRVESGGSSARCRTTRARTSGQRQAAAPSTTAVMPVGSSATAITTASPSEASVPTHGRGAATSRDWLTRLRLAP